jgi:hypothetical protein
MIALIEPPIIGTAELTVNNDRWRKTARRDLYRGSRVTCRPMTTRACKSTQCIILLRREGGVVGILTNNDGDGPVQNFRLSAYQPAQNKNLSHGGDDRVGIWEGHPITTNTNGTCGHKFVKLVKFV